MSRIHTAHSQHQQNATKTDSTREMPRHGFRRLGMSGMVSVDAHVKVGIAHQYLHPALRAAATAIGRPAVLGWAPQALDSPQVDPCI